MFRTITTGLMCLFLSGCILTPEPETEIVYRDKPLVHPTLPEPATMRYNQPYIITKETMAKQDDNAVFQCFEYDDGQDLGVDMERARAYIRELTAVLCSYRENLDEPLCRQYNGDFSPKEETQNAEDLSNQD